MILRMFDWLGRGEWQPDTTPCTSTTPGKAITSGHLPPGTPCEIHHVLPPGSARGFDANLCRAPPRPRRCLSAAELAATRWDPPADGAIFIAGCHVSTGNVIGHWGRGLRLSPVTVGRRRAVHGWWAAWRRPGGTSPASALSPAPGAGVGGNRRALRRRPGGIAWQGARPVGAIDAPCRGHRCDAHRVENSSPLRPRSPRIALYHTQPIATHTFPIA